MPTDDRIIIGFDPGLAASGYGLIAVSGSRARHIDHGVITSSPRDSEEIRLKFLHQSIIKIIAEYMPSEAGIESIFFAKNVRSAFPVAQARGVILLSCAEADILVHSFSPPQIKKCLTGVGTAGKGQIQQMVQLLLGLTEPPESDHAADALAAAYCVWQEGNISAILQI